MKPSCSKSITFATKTRPSFCNEVLVPSFAMSTRHSSLGCFSSSDEFCFRIACWERFFIENSLKRGFGVVCGPENNGVSFKIGSLREISRSVAHPLNYYFSGIALVSLLDLFGGPSAILWGVISFIVSSIQGETFLIGWPHIFIELLVAFSPLLTDFNSTSTIILVLMEFFVITTVTHAFPYVVEWRTSIFPRHFGANSAYCRMRQVGG